MRHLSDLARAPAADTGDRLTPLGRRLVQMIRTGGPIGVDRYMELALADPELGYYMTRDPLGVAGDFTTSPEISQVFGEIIGAWCAAQWQAIGEPTETLLIELGPGRGTLADDLLRALRVLPACRQSIRLHLVESSPVLRQRQAALLAAHHPDIRVQWHETLESVPAGPCLMLANEFFDALPVRQAIRCRGIWHERAIGLDEADRLSFVTGPALDPTRSAVLDAQAPVDAEGIFETCPAASALACMIGARLAANPGAALLIDYGYRASAFGDSFQAVRDHLFVDPLGSPGAADLTAHVDFSALAQALEAAGASIFGPIDQRDFLIRNGAVLRAEVLSRGAADAALAATIRHGVERLLDPAGMGRLFQVLAATSPGHASPPGF